MSLNLTKIPKPLSFSDICKQITNRSQAREKPSTQTTNRFKMNDTDPYTTVDLYDKLITYLTFYLTLVPKSLSVSNIDKRMANRSQTREKPSTQTTDRFKMTDTDPYTTVDGYIIFYTSNFQNINRVAIHKIKY